MALFRCFIRLITFGLQIERKTDVLALAAFFIAVGGIIFQLTSYLRGPVVRLFPPDQVALREVVFPNGNPYLALVARMAYVNTGYIGYNGTIRREVVHFRLDGRQYEQVWEKFVATDSEGKKFIETVKEPAKPLPVNAGSSESHETAFAPRVVRCRPTVPDCNPNANYLSWEEFLKKLRYINHLRLEFKAEVYGKTSIEAVCYVDITPSLRRDMIELRWVSPTCWSTE